MTGFAEELKELREETKNLIFKIGELFKAESSRGSRVPSQESEEVSQISSTNRDFARVSVSVALPDSNTAEKKVVLPNGFVISNRL